MVLKDIDERKNEVKNVMNKLNELELSHGLKINVKLFPELAQFYKICQEYIKTGERFVGSIMMPLIGRELCYEMPREKTRNVKVALKCK
eukprot:762478-Hanusia_phi.AAC.3